MSQYYLINTTNRIVFAKDKNDLVNKMRGYDWDGHSTNSDYMHVFSYKCPDEKTPIRHDCEEKFIQDLIDLGYIKCLNLSCLLQHFILHPVLEKVKSMFKY